MEDCVKRITDCNIAIARYEMDRRKVTNGESMSKIVREANDVDIEDSYNTIKKVLDELRFQKDTNEMLIKQGLIFSTKMLELFSPNKKALTYNAYGKAR